MSCAHKSDSAAIAAPARKTAGGLTSQTNPNTAGITTAAMWLMERRPLPRA